MKHLHPLFFAFFLATSLYGNTVAPPTILCSILSTTSSCSVLDNMRKYTYSLLVMILSVSIIPVGNFLMVLTLRETTQSISFALASCHYLTSAAIKPHELPSLPA